MAPIPDDPGGLAAFDPVEFQAQANALVALVAAAQAIDLDRFEGTVRLVGDLGVQVAPDNIAAQIGYAKMREAIEAAIIFRDVTGRVFADDLANVPRPGV